MTSNVDIYLSIISFVLAGFNLGLAVVLYITITKGRK